MTEFISTIKGIAIGIYEHFFVKVWYSLAVPFITFTFGIHNTLVIQVIFILIIIDFITGITSAYMAGEKITSRRTVKTAFKVVIYGILISSGHLVEKILPGTFFIEEIVSSFLGLTEFISILENAGKMGYGVPQKLLHKLQEMRDDK